MAAAQLQRIVHRIGAMVEPDRRERRDGDLLQAYCLDRDERAFAELLRRHGGPVMGVCRRVLGDHSSADDAWQSTFLVLARRAKDLQKAGSLAGWLHGVAYRTSLNVRRAARRRRIHEAQSPSRPVVAATDRQVAWRELQEIVDQEIAQLPMLLRDVFVRCGLGDEGRAEVAHQLGIEEGTVRSRLASARRILRSRLLRQGLSLSTILALAGAGAQSVSAQLRARTLEGAIRQLDASFSSKILGTSLMGIPLKKITVSLLLVVGLIAGALGTGRSENPPGDTKLDKPTPPIAPGIAVQKELLPDGAIARLGTTHFRTGNMVNALTFSPDGKQFASWGNAMYQHDSFAIWDAGSGKQLKSFRTSERSLLALGWPAAGPGIAVLKSGEIWDFTAEKPSELPKASGGFPIVAPKGDGLSYEAVALSNNGKYLAALEASGPGQKGISIYELTPTKSINKLKKLASCAAVPTTCKSLTFTPDGLRIIGACTVDKEPADQGILHIWTRDGKPERTIELPAGSKQWDDYCMATSDQTVAVGMGNGDTFVASLSDGKSRIFKTGHRAKVKLQGAGVLALAFSSDGKWLTTTGNDGVVRIAEVATAKIIREFGNHAAWPQAVAFDASGTRIISGGQDGVIHVWDATTGKDAVPTKGHGYAVWRLAVSADGKTVATDANERTIRIWDAGILRLEIASVEDVAHIQLSPDGKKVIALVGEWDVPNKRFKVWDTQSGKDVTPTALDKSVMAGQFEFSPDGKLLLLAFENKLSAMTWPECKSLWASEMPKPAKQPGINRVGSMSISPDGNFFVTTADRSWFREEKGLRFGYGADGIIDLWETATGKYVRRLIDSDGSCFQRPAIFAADGKVLHSGAGLLPFGGVGGKAEPAPRNICVLDPLTGRVLREFTPSDRPDSIGGGRANVLSADGKVLFVATSVGEVWAFEVASGKLRTAYPGHFDMVFSITAPSNDVRRVISGSKDTTALVWNVGFGSKIVVPIAEGDRAALWEGLSDPDGAKAFTTMQKWANDPSSFIALAKAKLKPAPASPTAEDLKPIFRDLDSPRFATREAAAAKLAKYGEGAVTLVRAELEKNLTEEVRDRLTKYLDRINGQQDGLLMQTRVIELLEHLGTPEAKSLLTNLSSGGVCRQSLDAAGALKRVMAR